ncbi:gliding motility-associated C-terminal domain-containing protein [Flaviaesturariibacter aridisoli]|uniref:T9SS type B sorting domain-containing protein n=1 Tax=Flaviaesturariibacter aridisoli TaxID=2545761 RepID=UPI0014054820|nr:gliding motility-associated C-terminal domain-containing protein [Flaviaesturariibacter aridisoli]
MCFPIATKVPDIHGQTDDYEVVQIAGAGAPAGSCFAPYTSPNDPAGTSTSITTDDVYSSVINLGFNFKFWGTSYNSVVVSTNGVISFNTALAGARAHWQINVSGGTLSGTGTPLDLPSTLYDASLIMGPYHDILPGVSPSTSFTNSPTQKIQYQVIGTAPYRRFVFSFYKVPSFDCTSQIENTHQIVLYETTNIVEVFVYSREICSGWNGGRAMIGLQNQNKTRGVMAPGRKASSPLWGGTLNEAWRFIPKNGSSLLNRVELVNSLGTVVANGVPGAATGGYIPVSFPNFCVPVSNTSNYVVRAVYNDPDNPGGFLYGTDTFRVSVVSGIAANATVVPAGCTPNGSITVNVTSGTGTPPYTYQLNNGTPQSSNVFNNLPAGNYTVTIKDVTGCTNVLSVTVAQINPLAGTATTTPAACSPTGSITINVTPGSGTGPYTYALDGGTPQNSNIFTGVAGGAHNVLITDLTTTCTRSVPATVSNINNLSGTATTTPSGCSPATGTVTITPSLGTPPYSFSIDGGPSQTSNVFTSIGVGLHTIVITDAATCTKTVNAIVAGLPIPKPNIASTPTTGSGCTPSGSITVNLTAGSGVAPFTYVLNPGATSQTTNVFTGLAAGTYSVTVTDAVGCVVTKNNIVVAASPALTATATGTPSGCTPSGTVTVTGIGGTPPLRYAINGGTSQTSNVFNALTPGVYNVTVSDASGCTATATATVAATGTLTASGTSTPSGCAPASGTIDITVPAGSGVAPYTYALDGAAAQPGNTFSGVASGAHSVVVKDNAGCTYTVSVTVGSTPSPTLTVTGTPAGCSPIGTITATAASGTAPFTYTLDAGTAQASGQFNNVAAGPHTVVVTDSKGCTATQTYTTTTYPALVASIASTGSGCTPPSGTITATVNAGAGLAPFTFSLDGAAAQATGSFTGIAAGSHSVVVSDAAGCTVTLNTTVSAPAALAGTATTTPSGCVPSGTLTVTMSNGVAPFIYVLDGGAPQPANTFTNLPAGPHTVAVTDAQGCTVTLSATVDAPPTLAGSAATTASGCTPSGTITITMANGVAPYTYTLDAGAPQGTNSFSNVASGNHSVVVVDAQGCTTTIPANVAAPSPLTGTPATTASGCIPSGSITITMTNGIAPYTYVLDGGAVQGSNTFNAVAVGTHSVLVTDASGCTVTIPVTVDATAPITGSATTTASGCNPTGSISITMNNGVAPFQYALDGGAQQAGNTFNLVGAGPHSVVVTDAQGCSTTITSTVGNLPALTATATTTPTGCSPSGTITVTVPSTVGVAPFTYSVDGGASQASNVLGSLDAGDHTVLVGDATGCTYSFAANVGAPTPLAATVTSHTTSCNGSANGSAVLHPGNGIAPFQFQIGTSGWQASDSFPNLAVGTYDLYFKDASGCLSGAFQAVITAGPAITATEAHTNVSCFGGSNGTATLTLSANATAPFQFSSDNWASTQSANLLTGLPAGTHTLWFRDAVGCSNSIGVTITEPTQLVAGAPTVVSPLCNGAANGSVTLSATGGTAPYTYSFNNSPFVSTATFPASAGTFNFQVRDANNCATSTRTVTVTDPALLKFDAITIGDATCDTMGRVWAYASGGTAPYRFQLDNGGLQRDSSFKVPANTYQLTVRDTNNCQAQQYITINQVNNLTYTRPTVATICEGSSATLTPVTNATQFNWNGPRLTPNNAAQSSVTVRPTSDTVYHLVYTLGSCSANDDIPVSVYAAPTPDAGTVAGICSGSTAQLNAAPGFVEYQWSPVNYLSNPAVPNPTVTGAPAPGVNFFLMVKDGNGCWSLIPDTVRLSVTAPIAVRINPVDTVMYIGDTLHLNTLAAATQFVWTNSLGQTPANLTNPNIADPVLLVDKNEILKVHVTDANGCTGDGFFYLRAYQGPEIYVPSAFTPNRDGKNDLLRPVCVGVNTLTYFRVFDRWGQLMYEYKGEKRGPEVYNLLSSNIGWDGRHKGSDLGTGSFVWVAEGITKEGKVITRKGIVTIIR